ncbi:DoxX family protein [Arenibacterium sp. CAU 1754]
MNFLISLYARIIHTLEYGVGPIVMPALARFLFAALFIVYYWNSAVTKLGGSLSGLINPSFNAFAQIFPKAAEAASYDVTQATSFQKLVILGGTWAEFILPALIIIGLLTRPAAFGMIGFVIVQSLTDLFGHGAINDGKTLGAWFDGAPDSIILDQRALWVILLLVLVFRGAGPLSLDRLVARRFGLV